MADRQQPEKANAAPLGSVLLRVAEVVFTVECFIMLGFLSLHHGTIWWHYAILDASLLTLVVTFVLRRWILQPLNRQLSETIESLKEARQAAERLAETDSLTGILNRRAFFDRFEQEWQKSERTDRPLSLLLLDIDFFKAFNDTHGHRAGDAVLKHIAQLIQFSCRAYDGVGRYGGEEFCVTLCETPLAVAVEIAERLRTLIAETPVLHDGQELTATVSIGVAERDHQTPDLTALIEAADQSLFEAKRTGRNRVCTQSVDVSELPAVLESANA